MKWVTIISLVILLSFTESRVLKKRHHHEDHHEDPHEQRKTVGEVFNLVGEEKFKALGMIIFAQYLQKCPYEEQAQRVKDVTELAERCSKGIKTAECGKSVITVALDEICKTPEDAVKYPFHAECCAKADPDRNACFISHKLTAPDALPPYERPTGEQLCKDYKENRVTVMGHYLYIVARRHPMMYSPAIVSVTKHFEAIVVDCCKDEATANHCFEEKMPAHAIELEVVNAIQNHNCLLLSEFGERALKAVKLIRMSQKYPKASFKDVHEIAEDVAHMHKDCCGGDMMECMIERLDLTNKVCNKQEAYSSHLKECCDKPVIERSECIVKMEFDEKPADLTPQVREFFDDPDVCKKYADQKDLHLARFAYEHSRRHQDFSTELLLRNSKAYQEYLTKCCQEEKSNECLAKGEDELKKDIITSKEILKQNCEGLEKLGPYHFQNALLVKYTGKMPQVTDKTLLEMTKAMTHVAVKCCKEPEDKRMSCSEGGLSLIIGDMCNRQKHTFVNDNVARCCSESYSGRTPCFIRLGVDESYVPPALSPDMFKFSADLCTVSPTELETRKKTFLIHVIKQEPHITDDQLKSCIARFLSMLEQGCKADNHEEYFAVEGPKLIEKCQALVGVKPDVHVAV